MSTLIDKLNYLEDTKTVFKETMAKMGQHFEENTPFRKYLDWLSPLEKAAQKNGKINQIEGYSFQSYFPSQDNPAPISIATGKCLLMDNAHGNVYGSDQFGEGWNYNLESGFNLNHPSPWVYIAEPEDTQFSVYLPNANKGDQIIISINYVFSLGSYSFPVVPFKVYISSEEDSERIEIYDSEGAQKGQINYSFISDGISYYHLIFENINGNNISIIFPEAKIVNKGISRAIEIDLKDTELVGLEHPHSSGYYGDGIRVKISQNLFDKNSDYIVGGEWQEITPEPIYDVEIGEYRDQDSYYKIIQDEINPWTVTPLDTGIKMACNKRSGSCNILFPLKSEDINVFASGGDIRIQGTINIVGDRVFKIGFGRLIEETNSIGIWDYSDNFTKDEENNIVFQHGYPALELQGSAAIIFSFDPGANATENDYIEITNLQCFDNSFSLGSVSLKNDSYVPYKEGFYFTIDPYKGTTKKVFNGTESNWTCTETNISGIYAMELTESENDPWYGWHSQIEDYDWDPETGEEIEIIKDVYGEAICSHFIKSYYQDKIQNGYFSFFGDHIIFYTNQQTTLQEWLTWLTTNNITIYYETGYYNEENGTYERGIPGEVFKITDSDTREDLNRENEKSITNWVNTSLENLTNYGYIEG